MSDSTNIKLVGDERVIDARESAVAAKGERRRRRLGLRFGLVGLLATMAVLVCSAAALADSASISVTNTAGESDPAADLPRVFTVSGSTSEQERIYIKDRPAGGIPCAPTAVTDPGEWFDGFGSENGDLGDEQGPVVEPVTPFKFQNAFSWSRPGNYMFCIWIASWANEIVSPITQDITFRYPRGTISATVAPIAPNVNENATVTVTGNSEATEHIYAKIHEAGATTCAPTYQSDSGEELIEGTSVNGSFSVQATTMQSKAGQYVICLWLGSSASETSPIAGPQPETFTVVSPPAPCVVPKLASGASLAGVEQEIRAADCTVGSISSVASTKVARGGVLSLNPASGATLSPGAAVNIVESAGRPCVIPAVKSGSTLARVEHQLAAADCAVSVGYVHSRRIRRGQVIGLASRPHTRLSPRARVRVIVSSGRGYGR